MSERTSHLPLWRDVELHAKQGWQKRHEGTIHVAWLARGSPQRAHSLPSRAPTRTDGDAGKLAKPGRREGGREGVGRQPTGQCPSRQLGPAATASHLPDLYHAVNTSENPATRAATPAPRRWKRFWTSARQLDEIRIFALVVPPHGSSQVNSNRMYPRARILEGTDRRDAQMRRVDERELRLNLPRWLVPPFRDVPMVGEEGTVEIDKNSCIQSARGRLCLSGRRPVVRQKTRFGVRSG